MCILRLKSEKLNMFLNVDNIACGYIVMNQNGYYSYYSIDFLLCSGKDIVFGEYRERDRAEKVLQDVIDNLSVGATYYEVSGT